MKNNLMKNLINEIVLDNPDFRGNEPVIEKEILQQDILEVMNEKGILKNLVFMGGTSLRVCYGSPRLSEDLDFNGGFDFNPSDLNGVEAEIKKSLQEKYGMAVSVNKPNPNKQGNTDSWKVTVEREYNRPDIPRQKISIDICSIPSFDVETKPIRNHYGIDMPTEGMMIPVQSLRETLADKLIAVAYRSRRIKPRDLWDIAWINGRGQGVSSGLINKKLEARGKDREDFEKAFCEQVDKVINDDFVKQDFFNEMTRFLPIKIKNKMFSSNEAKNAYWDNLKSVILESKDILFKNTVKKIPSQKAEINVN